MKVYRSPVHIRMPSCSVSYALFLQLPDECDHRYLRSLPQLTSSFAVAMPLSKRSIPFQKGHALQLGVRVALCTGTSSSSTVKWTVMSARCLFCGFLGRWEKFGSKRARRKNSNASCRLFEPTVAGSTWRIIIWSAGTSTKQPVMTAKRFFLKNRCPWRRLYANTSARSRLRWSCWSTRP